MVNFSNFSLLWVSKLQTEISIYTLHSEYVALSHYARALLPLNSITKEVIDSFVIVFEKLKFMSSSTVYEDNNGSKVMATSTKITLTSKHITVKSYWFRQDVGKKFLIWKIES